MVETLLKCNCDLDRLCSRPYPSRNVGIESAISDSEYNVIASWTAVGYKKNLEDALRIILLR